MNSQTSSEKPAVQNNPDVPASAVSIQRPADETLPENVVSDNT